MKKLIKDGCVIKKVHRKHSRNSIKLRKEAKTIGRHKGIGKREGTSNARNSDKMVWVIKQRVLRNILKKFKNSRKIDRHLYRELYLKCKGNVFKNKRVLIDFIHKAKFETIRKKNLLEEFNKKREKQKLVRNKKIDKFNEKMNQIYKNYQIL